MSPEPAGSGAVRGAKLGPLNGGRRLGGLRRPFPPPPCRADVVARQHRAEGAGAAHADVSGLSWIGGDAVCSPMMPTRRRPGGTRPRRTLDLRPRVRRAFALNNYPELKMLNPRTPILVREGEDVVPTLIARFGAPASGLAPCGPRPLPPRARPPEAAGCLPAQHTPPLSLAPLAHAPRFICR